MMTSKVHGNILSRIYYTWKALKLPWRRRVFVGMLPQNNKSNAITPTMADCLTVRKEWTLRATHFGKSLLARTGGFVG